MVLPASHGIGVARGTLDVSAGLTGLAYKAVTSFGPAFQRCSATLMLDLPYRRQA
jgi:hypothetical protein